MKDLLEFFKLLSDETRLRIIMLLSEKELCVCQLTGITGINQPNMSKHLSRLKDRGLVKDRREEQFIFYSLEENQLTEIFVDYINENIDDYPILKSDSEKALVAEIYIDMVSKS